MSVLDPTNHLNLDLDKSEAEEGWDDPAEVADKGGSMAKLSVNIDPELDEQLRSHCAMRKLALNEDVTKTDVVREALISYLDGFAQELETLIRKKMG